MNAHGWKTYLGAAIMILTAVQNMVVNHDYSGGLKTIALGLVAAGLGHKLAKIIQAITGLNLGG